MSTLIILDRDGVINYESEAYIKSPEEWHPIPGSIEAICKLTQAGFKIAIATNQSGIGRGHYTIEILKTIHQKMLQQIKALGGELDEDAIFFCPHIDEDNCHCRKPKTGLFEQIAKHFHVDFASQETLFIGDSLRDIQAALKIGCHPILVRTGFGEATLKTLPPKFAGIPVYDDLLAATRAILAETMT